MLGSQWALEIAAQACLEPPSPESLARATFFLFDSIRKHCTGAVFSVVPLEIIARALFEATIPDEAGFFPDSYFVALFKTVRCFEYVYYIVNPPLQSATY